MNKYLEEPRDYDCPYPSGCCQTQPINDGLGNELYCAPYRDALESVTMVLYPESASKNVALATHWRDNRKAKERDKENAMMVAKEAMGKLPLGWKKYKLPLAKCEITIVQYHSNIPLDYEGLAVRAAASVDGIVLAGMILDDKPSVVLKYDLRHQKVHHRPNNRIEITVSLPKVRTSGEVLLVDSVDKSLQPEIV